MSLRSTSYSHYTDADLLPLIAGRSGPAFDELYHRYGQKLFGYFYRMLWKNKELAEDNTQELFIKLIKHAAAFEADKTVATWLYSIAHNMCKNEYRKQEVRTKHATVMAMKPAVQQAANPDLPRFKEAVHHCIAALEEEKRQLFALRFTEQLSITDISAVLQVPEGTVKSRLFYLLKEVKETLKPFKTIATYP